jgi:hypothetical protein
MMARKPSITVQLRPEVADRLYAYMEGERRSLSNAAARLIEMGLATLAPMPPYPVRRPTRKRGRSATASAATDHLPPHGPSNPVP